MRMHNGFKKLIAFVLATVTLIGTCSISTIAYDITTSSLQYNQTMDEDGNWVHSGGSYNTNWENYNCYAFSINRVEYPQFYSSGNYPQYAPGNISKSGDANSVPSIDDLADLVCNDLLSLGYSNIVVSNIIPTVNQDDELICVRINSNNGFHFMQYDYDTNAWYHKPGNTAVLKYVDNDGIPENSVVWFSEMSHSGLIYVENVTYNSNIRFIKYSKNQLNVSWGEDLTQDITVKAGKDVIYEIVVDESDSYNIQLYSQCGDLSFNYEIYSYNKFNGNYTTLESGSATSGSTITETVNLVAYDDYNDGNANWQYFVNKFYLRLDFGQQNLSDETIRVRISHNHSYTDDYDYLNDTFHQAYCECEDVKLVSHSFDQYIDITDTHHTGKCVCNLTEEAEEHYHHHYERDGSSTHKVYCECGHYIGAYFHVVPVGDALYKWCIHCGQKIYSKIEITPVPGGLNSTTPSIRYITEAGSYVDSDGIIYLVESDMALYLAGELDVYALAQNVGDLVTQ